MEALLGKLAEKISEVEELVIDDVATDRALEVIFGELLSDF